MKHKIYAVVAHVIKNATGREILQIDLVHDDVSGGTLLSVPLDHLREHGYYEWRENGLDGDGGDDVGAHSLA